MQSSLREWLKTKTSANSRRWLRKLQAGASRAWIRFARLFSSPLWPRNPDGKVFLNLGCGDVTHPSFINVDARPAWHIHYIRPIENLRPIPDNFADLVYASHCLEHFSHNRVKAVLTEWRRVLKPGGVLRIGVPDFDQILAVYQAAGRDIDAIQLLLMGGQDYALNAHYVSFTQRSLSDQLTAVGFTQVRPWQRGSDELTSLPDFTGLTATISENSPKISFGICRGTQNSTPGRQILVSLNLEAVK